jgi:hypothetical protein
VSPWYSPVNSQQLAVGISKAVSIPECPGAYVLVASDGEDSGFAIEASSSHRK